MVNWPCPDGVASVERAALQGGDWLKIWVAGR